MTENKKKPKQRNTCKNKAQTYNQQYINTQTYNAPNKQHTI
jgi:hypothetical protein